MATTTTQRREKTLQDKIAEAKLNYSYIRVPSANKGKTKSGPLVLSGAKNRWEAKGEKNFIYQPTLRMAGTIEEFRAWLQNPIGGQQPAQQTEVYIQNSFRWDNHNSNDTQIMIGNHVHKVKEAFDAEVASLKGFRSQQKSVAANEPKLDLDDLTVLLQSMDLGQGGPKVAGVQGAVANKKGRTTDVASKFANLAADKVLDVTGYTATGTGARTIPKPAQGSNKAVLDPSGQHEQLSRTVFDFSKPDRSPAINFLMALGYPQDQAVAYLSRVAPQTMIPVVGGAAMPQSFPSNNYQAPRVPSPARTMSPPRGAGASGSTGMPLPTLPNMGGARSPMPSMPALPGLASPQRGTGGLPTLPSLGGMTSGALPSLPGMGNF